MTEEQKNFINLLKCTIFAEDNSYSPVSNEVVEIAAKHAMLHLICLKTAENYPALFRSIQYEFTLERIKAALNKAEIPFVPMKGAIIRYLYPQPWMRISTDIDILIMKERLDDAINALVAIGGAADESAGGHDIKVVFSAVTVELHFRLDYLDDPLLGRAWDYAELYDCCEYRFTDAFFYYSFIAHTAQHFLSGGAGVRSILDLQFVPRDHSILSGTRLEAFAASCEALSDKWFGDADVEVNECFEQMILEGSIFFDRKQWIELEKIRNRENIGIFHRIFLPYDTMKYRYPLLKKHKVLLPFYEMKRITDMLKQGRVEEHLKEFEYRNVSSGRTDEIRNMLIELGL